MFDFIIVVEIYDIDSETVPWPKSIVVISENRMKSKRTFVWIVNCVLCLVMNRK